MDWYYVEGGDRKGPVAEEEFQRLAQQGVITSGTLVWREGMTEWRPYGDTMSASLVSTTSEPLVTCTGCGLSFERSQVIGLGHGLYCASCKPRAVQQLREGVTPSSGAAEEVRKQYLNHEASVRSVGFLYYFAGGALFLMGALLATTAGARSDGIVIALSLFFVVLGAGLIWVGYGLRRLKRWARLPVGILSGMGLLGFPLGTIIHGYILYLVFSQKGKMVFSDEYRAVIAQTPHIKYRTSIIVWILLILVVALIAIGLLVAFLAPGPTR
jgi:hypothetical protein